MRSALFGATLIAVGVAAQIVAGQNHPGHNYNGNYSRYLLGPPGPSPATGWSHATYEIVRAGGWALIVFGVVVVAVALVREFRQTT